jgi:membrane-associated protease RseP (regulator of RpoE activity)
LIEAVFALLSLLGTYVALNVIFLTLTYLPGRTVQATPLLTSFSHSLNWIESLVFIILIVLVAPVAEEVFFRGMLYNALRQRFHTVLAAPYQPIVFGLAHLPYGQVNSAAIALMGLICALLYEWRKTLLAPILLHCMVNVVGVSVLMWGIAAEAAAPRLGVGTEAHESGCQVTFVAPGGAADATGLKIGDVITSADGKAVADPPNLIQIIRSKRVGDNVIVEFLRQGTSHQVNTVLKKLQQ